MAVARIEYRSAEARARDIVLAEARLARVSISGRHAYALDLLGFLKARVTEVERIWDKKCLGLLMTSKAEAANRQLLQMVIFSCCCLRLAAPALRSDGSLPCAHVSQPHRTLSNDRSSSNCAIV